MAQFLANPLRVLDRIYRFVEGAAPKSVENVLPIQLVHDVSRAAELGGTGMGYFISGQDNTHGAANVQENAWDPYAEVAYLYPNVTDTWVWLIQAWNTLSTLNVNWSNLTVGYAPLGEYMVRRDRPIQVWNGAVASIFDQGVAPANHPYSQLPSAALPQPHPVLITPGSTMRGASSSSGVLVCRIEGLFWAGPMGSCPPDMG